MDLILRLEALDAGLAQLDRYFGAPLAESARNVGESHQSVCAGAAGCRPDELGALLNGTEHTRETLRLTGELYADDFRLLGYRRFDEREVAGG